jgi:prophage DNA circulation protein
MTIRAKARLDNFLLDMETVEDTLEKAIAEYEFAYRDGADLDDMGAHARRITFRCHFLGDSYDSHEDFIAHVSETGNQLYKLTHPVYGLVEGKVARVHVVKDKDTLDDAPVDIDFIEQLNSESGFGGAVQVSVNVISNAIEDTFQLGQLEQMAEVASDFFDAVGSEANDMINAVLDPGKTLVDSFVTASLSARDVLHTIDNGIAQAGALLSSTTIPATELVSIIEYPLTLPGRVVSTLAQATARQAQALQGLASVPSHYINALASSLAALAGPFTSDLFPMAKHLAIASAQTLALQSAYRYDEDEQQRQILKSVETLQSFDILGNYLNPPTAGTVMTIDELESTLALVRGNLQAVIEQARDKTCLKTLAASLLQHVSSVKLDRENIVTRVYKSTMPLHLICLRENLPYNYAERILSINPQAQNPSFLSGEVSVYAG